MNLKENAQKTLNVIVYAAFVFYNNYADILILLFLNADFFISAVLQRRIVMKKKHVLICTIAALLCFSGTAWAAPANSQAELIASGSNAQAPSVEVRTEDEIREFYDSHPFSFSGSSKWDVTPSLSSETAGKLSGDTVTQALNALNFIRFIAGIPSDVSNNEDYEAVAQAGTTLLTGVGTLSHNPAKASRSFR